MSNQATRALFTLTLTLAITLPVGCASSGAVTATPGSTRTVSVGSEVIIRLPATIPQGREWRLTSFDSAKLPVTQRPRIETTDRGERKWVVRFIARAPGDTSIEFRRVAIAPGAPGSVGQLKQYRFRIRN